MARAARMGGSSSRRRGRHGVSSTTGETVAQSRVAQAQPPVEAQFDDQMTSAREVWRIEQQHLLIAAAAAAAGVGIGLLIDWTIPRCSRNW